MICLVPSLTAVHVSSVHVYLCVCLACEAGKQGGRLGVAAWPAGQCLPVFVYSTVQLCRPVSGQSCDGRYISCH